METDARPWSVEDEEDRLGGRLLPAETANSFGGPYTPFANSLTRALLQQGLGEVESNWTVAASPESSGRRSSGNLEGNSALRVHPGSQLASPATTPPATSPLTSQGLSSRESSAKKSQDLEAWSESVLRQLASKEARRTPNSTQRQLERLTPGDIAAIFGVSIDVDADKEKSSNATGQEGARPRVPKLNLASIRREDEDEEEEEDFDNKVGSDAVGVLPAPSTQKPAVNIPPLPLQSLPGELSNQQGSVPNQNARKLVPLAQILQRRSKRDLSMYCDDLTLMLFKQNRGARNNKRAMSKSKTAVELPPLQPHPGPKVSHEKAITGVQDIVHAHFHYHYHVPS
ncbi:unnamed protein product [Effrenium voratum]|uniref:Uncharacterized protein n=1 Tax=Effrenium voratum TaxID=2562239 RepID=A0AA36MI23_9DINO|nr:unnamed protein product [Effrenium voratum]CAJ1437212.1 unnamed protein product [Effrenium voratum]|mmetsp:Transcript_28961/g.68863  ORF Transcript_28961/g.68863 Transcript_28961/m.68863 type:complete len:342 (-) Transcript_28961:275-1300(-)|eukprot:CAMPEP_0181425666 /NCGR_PEP_ID=MMETSP1110-20121109/15275_1 /TAXON_ID=174948 /ORGANISM="Symbiodinium sp., Strain CCMP421" /LENGTH=341 /DNA_ID=CAMNT_0023548857 /DNA_START=39 /DNA_END=1064 /DNA_ORIENTATION=-